MTPKRNPARDLDIDVEGGVVPISKAASSLAALIKRARERHQPIIVTQKGYPTGVILDVGLYTALHALAQEAATGNASKEEQAEPRTIAPQAPVPEAEPRVVAGPAAARKGRGGRQRKTQSHEERRRIAPML